MRRWRSINAMTLRTLPQVTTFFGIAMIALIWGAAEYDLKRDYDRSEADAVASNDNLVRLFEDQMIRTIKANDSLLRSLQLSAANGTLAAGFDRWSGDLTPFFPADFLRLHTLIDDRQSKHAGIDEVVNDA